VSIVVEPIGMKANPSGDLILFFPLGLTNEANTIIARDSNKKNPLFEIFMVLLFEFFYIFPK
jgi:hypothetical protein